MLAYLFLKGKKSHHRLALAELLSPEAPETTARRLLNQALWYIRRSFPGLLACEADEILLSPGCLLVTDVAEFEQHVLPYKAGTGKVLDVIGDLNQAVELYRGDLLEYYYDDWVLPERERPRELYLLALEILVRTYIAAREYRQALSVSLLLAKGDPLRESNQRDVIRLHHLLGNNNAAVKHFQEYQQLLLSELKLDPDPETVELIREIVRRSGLRQPPFLPESAIPAGQSLLETGSPEQLPLIGRSSEKKLILEQIEGLFLQRGTIVLISGEPGIGKTRLLQEVQRDLEWRGAQVLVSKAQPLQPAQAIDPLIQLIREGLSPLRIEQIRSLVSDERLGLLNETLVKITGEIVPSVHLDPVLAQNERQRMMKGLSCVLSLWSQATPLVLILEDFHWAGEDTWELLAYIVDDLFTEDPVRTGILISLRPEEAQARPWIQTWMAKIDAAGVLTEIKLRPLERLSSGMLIRTFLGIQQSFESIETYLYQETGGNPLFILESLRFLYSQGALNRGAGMDGQNGYWQFGLEERLADVPPVVKRLLARRIEILPHSAAQVLQYLSVLGNSIDFAMLLKLCGLQVNQLLDSLHTLVEAHFLVETSQDYRFTNDLLIQVSYDSIPVDRRKEIHAQVGYLLESLHPEQVELLAYHFEAGLVIERALHYHDKAGEAAFLRHAYHQAASHFQKAIIWAVEACLSPERLFDLYYRLESILDILGERDAQMQALEAMDRLIQQQKPGFDSVEPDISSTEIRLRVLLRWANLYCALGQYPQSEKVSREALSLAEGVGDERLIGQALLAIGSALHGAGKDKQAVPYLKTAIPYLRSTDERQAESKAWQTLSVIYIDASQHTLAFEANEAARNLNQMLDNRPALARDLIMTGAILFEQGDLTHAEPYFHEALQISRSLGNLLYEAFALDWIGNLSVERGLPGHALEMFAKALELCRSLKEEKLRLSVLLEQTDLMITCLGDFEGAKSSLSEAKMIASSHNLARELAICMRIQAQIELLQGDCSRSRPKLEQAITQMHEQDCPKEEIRLRHLLVELELTCNHPAAAMLFLLEAEKLSQNLHIGSLRIQLLVDRSAVLLAMGKVGDALRASSEALNSLNPGNRLHYIASYRHFQALSACGRKTEAMQALAAAAQGLNALIDSLPPEKRKSCAEKLPIHREILQVWESLQPRIKLVSLPCRSGGKPFLPLSNPDLDQKEVQVRWTVWLPEDDDLQDKVERRRYQLRRLLEEAANQGAAPTQKHLAEALGVSLRTIAQDLAEIKSLQNSANNP